MKSDRPPFEARPGSAGIRSVQPREPLTRTQHLYLGIALVASLVLLLTLAWVVRQWQVKTLSKSATSPVQTESAGLSESELASNRSTAGIPAAALERGSHLVVGSSNPIVQINPLYLGHQDERDAAALIFESLLMIDPDGQSVFKLAADQSYDPDSRQLTFTLRDDHFFKDGSVLTAADVAWTYQLILSPSYEGPLKAHLAAVSGVTAAGPLHVTFQLADWVTEPDPAWFTVGILHASSYPADLDRVFELGQASPLPDGSGPYQLRDLSDGHATLELRPGFAGEVTTIEFRLIDSTDQFDLLQAGAIDITSSVWNERNRERLDSLPGYETVVFQQTAAYVLVNQTDTASSRLSKPGLPDALLEALAGHDLKAEQSELVASLGSESLSCPYYRGIDTSSEAGYLSDAKASLAPLAELGLDFTFEGLDWPELASRALEKRYDLMVIPALANEKLPAGTILLSDTSGKGSIGQANALPGASQDRVLFFCQRLNQLTVNPNANPLARTALSWTDRIENIRLTSFVE